MAKRLYLDYASATPMTPQAHKVLTRAARAYSGNPSGVHEEARAAKEALQSARATVARVCGVKPEECTFVSGGTEANNLAIRGVLNATGKSFQDLHFVTSSIEHSSILSLAHQLEREGVSVTYVAPTEEGIVTPEAVEAALTDKTALVSIQYVNSEIGTIQPIRKIGQLLQKRNIPLHTDAAQAPLYLPIKMETLAAQLISLDAQKCGGPRGVGALIHARAVPITSLLYGGDQERTLRPGTENVPGVLSFAVALEDAQNNYAQNTERVSEVRDYGFQMLKGIINGSTTHRIANNINLSFPGIDTEYLTVLLDTKGIAVATKSACETDTEAASHVVMALTDDAERAKSTLRITLGPTTTKKDIDRLQKTLNQCLQFLDESKLEL